MASDSLDQDKPNTALEQSLPLATAGSLEAIQSFYYSFIAGPLYVPDRYQTQALSNSPSYPTDLFNLLAIKQEDRVIIPAFSDLALIEEWFGKALKYRCLNGKQLAETTPNDWWICLNPSSEFNKEISPWEIKRLALGEEAISELLAEYKQEVPYDFSTRSAREEEYIKLKTELRKIAKDHSEVSALYLLVEDAKSSNEQITTSVLVGLLIDRGSPDKAKEIEAQIKSVADQCQIGDHAVKFFMGDSLDSIGLGIFRLERPFYKRSIWSWVRRLSTKPT